MTKDCLLNIVSLFVLLLCGYAENYKTSISTTFSNKFQPMLVSFVEKRKQRWNDFYQIWFLCTFMLFPWFYFDTFLPVRIFSFIETRSGQNCELHRNWYFFIINADWTLLILQICDLSNFFYYFLSFSKNFLLWLFVVRWILNVFTVLHKAKFKSGIKKIDKSSNKEVIFALKTTQILALYVSIFFFFKVKNLKTICHNYLVYITCETCSKKVQSETDRHK